MNRTQVKCFWICVHDPGVFFRSRTLYHYKYDRNHCIDGRIHGYYRGNNSPSTLRFELTCPFVRAKMDNEVLDQLLGRLRRLLCDDASTYYMDDVSTTKQETALMSNVSV